MLRWQRNLLQVPAVVEQSLSDLSGTCSSAGMNLAPLAELELPERGLQELVAQELVERELVAQELVVQLESLALEAESMVNGQVLWVVAPESRSPASSRFWVWVW